MSVRVFASALRAASTLSMVRTTTASSAVESVSSRYRAASCFSNSAFSARNSTRTD